MMQYLFDEKEKIRSLEEEFYALFNLLYTGLKFDYKTKDEILKSCNQKIFDFAIESNILKKDDSEEKYTISEKYNELIKMLDDGYKNYPLFVEIIQTYKKEIT